MKSILVRDVYNIKWQIAVNCQYKIRFKYEIYYELNNTFCTVLYNILTVNIL